LALVFVALLLPGLARAAAPGDLDRSFGLNGRVTPGLGPVTGFAVGPDGRSFALYTDDPYPAGGPMKVVAFDQDGAIDESFGDGGVANVPGAFYAASDLALDSQGRVVVAGSRAKAAGGYEVAVARFDSDGGLDGSFGDGGVVFLSQLGSAVLPHLAVQSDDKPVLLGSYHGFTFVRLQANGALDTSFSGDGVTEMPQLSAARPGSKYDFSVFSGQVAVAPDGGIIGVGHRYNGPSDSAEGVVARLTSTGNPDQAFNGGNSANHDGFVELGGSRGMEAALVQPDGKILVAGDYYYASSFVVDRILPDGRRDPDFGNGTGEVQTAFRQTPSNYDRRGEARAYALAIDSAGRILAAGVSRAAASFPVGFGLVRYLPDGSPDPSFGQDGRVNTTFGSTTNAAAFGIGLDPQGRIVLGGQRRTASDDPEMALARYHAEESPDDGGTDDGGDDQGEGGVAGGVAGGGKVGLQIHKVVVPKTAEALINRGVRVLASCAVRCKLIVNVDVGDGVAHRLGLTRTRIARGNASTAANKRRWVVARLTPAAAEALRTYGGGGRLQIRVRAVGPGAQSATASVAG
jgi:uncharacterized delta-60 repeat protein